MAAECYRFNPRFLCVVLRSLGIEPGSPAWVRAESIWARVIELEEAFWPVGGEELTMLSSSI